MRKYYNFQAKVQSRLPDHVLLILCVFLELFTSYSSSKIGLEVRFRRLSARGRHGLKLNDQSHRPFLICSRHFIDTYAYIF